MKKINEEEIKEEKAIKKKRKKRKDTQLTMTRCRDKRSIVRALNTFSKQKKYIKCDDTEVDLSIKPMTLLYSDEKYDSVFVKKKKKNENKVIDEHAKQRIEQEERYKLGSKTNIIFSKEEAFIDLQDTEIILETIDNLISLDYRPEIKEKLKDIINERILRGQNIFLSAQRENLSLLEIENIVPTPRFAKTIYSQIKNRIMFNRSGVYSTKDEGSRVTKGKMLKINPTDDIGIKQKQLKLILSELWLLDEETIEKVAELKNGINQEKANEHFNIEHTDFVHNSTMFHPIDEAEFNDESNSKEARRQTMPEAMLYREMYGLYDEELWSEYRELAEYYEERVSLLEESIFDIIDCIESQANREDKLEQNEYIKELIFEYRNEKIPFKKNELKKQLSLEFEDIEDFSTWHQYSELTASFKPYEYQLNEYGIYLTYKSYKEAMLEEKYLICCYEEIPEAEKYIEQRYHEYFVDKYIEEERVVKELEEEQMLNELKIAFQKDEDERIRKELLYKELLKEMDEVFGAPEKEEREKKEKREKERAKRKLIREMNKAFRKDGDDSDDIPEF